MDKNYNTIARATIRFAACTLLALASGAAFAQFDSGRIEKFSPGFTAWAASLERRPRK
jgi:hypothetical protein